MKKLLAVILLCLTAGAVYAAAITHRWSNVIIDNLVLPDNSIITPGMFLKRTGASGTNLGLWDNCATNEVPKWNGATWACAADAVNTGSNPVFDNVQSGTNTASILTLGSGGTLTYSGTGIVNANQFKGTATPTGAEFGYLSGVTSAIQTQLGTKEVTADKSDNTSLGSSATLYPTQNAVKSYVDGKFTDNTINGSKLIDNTITNAKLIDNTINGARLLDNSVSLSKLVNSTTFIGALAFKNTAQSIPNNTETALSLEGESYDTNSIHAVTGSDNTKLVVPSGATRVRLTGQVNFADNATGYRSVAIYKGGALFVGTPNAVYQPVSVAGGPLINITSPVITVVAGDWFAIYVAQNSGGALNVNGTATGNGTWLAMEIIE